MTFNLVTKLIFNNVTERIDIPVTFDCEHYVAEGSVNIVAYGLSNFENIYVWISGDHGYTYIPYYVSGNQVVLTNKNSVLKLDKLLHYGFTKDATALAVTCECVYFSSR
jgi:hypothetical protein